MILSCAKERGRSKIILVKNIYIYIYIYIYDMSLKKLIECITFFFIRNRVYHFRYNRMKEKNTYDRP